MKEPRHILFAAHPTVGHTSALRAMGGELRARGHRTSFAIVHVNVPFVSAWPEPVRAAATLPASIAAEGARVLKLTPSPKSLWHAARLPRAVGQAELENRPGGRGASWAQKNSKNMYLPKSTFANFKPRRADLTQSEGLRQNTSKEFESLFFLNMSMAFSSFILLRMRFGIGEKSDNTGGWQALRGGARAHSSD